MTLRFEFGENWKAFVIGVGDDDVRDAEASLERLFGSGEVLRGKSFLDIGCGSGLFCLAALRCGASGIVGIDVDPKSVEASRMLKQRFAPQNADWNIRAGSVLDQDFLSSLPDCDIVYSWGVLHHTGRMWDAIAAAAGKTAPGGLFAIAIYNRVWNSALWLKIKILYNRSGTFAQKMMVAALFSARACVRLLRLKHPFREKRGMSVRRDAVDWLGGLPYEYASPDEVRSFMAGLGFEPVSENLTRRNGCSEFVYRRPTIQCA